MSNDTLYFALALLAAVVILIAIRHASKKPRTQATPRGSTKRELPATIVEAIERLDTNALQGLIRSGQELEQVDRLGNRPMHHAVLRAIEVRDDDSDFAASLEILHELLSQGATTRASNNARDTPVTLAERFGHQRREQILAVLMHYRGENAVEDERLAFLRSDLLNKLSHDTVAMERIIGHLRQRHPGKSLIAIHEQAIQDWFNDNNRS